MNRSLINELLLCCGVFIAFLSIVSRVINLLAIFIYLLLPECHAPVFITGSNKIFKAFHIAHVADTGMWKMDLQKQVEVRISGHSCLTKNNK